VAEAHEGFVDIVDTPGWSTTFRVFLPLRTAGPTGRAAPVPERISTPGPGTAVNADPDHIRLA
jgi:hypothetical protein